MTENLKKSETKIKVSDEVRKEISNQIEECYKSDISEMIGSKKCWRRMGLSFETLSKITVAVGGVLSFSSGYFNSTILSFVSGSVSVMSLSLLQFGSFGFKQSKKQANDLNILLKKLDLETFPVLEDDPDSLINGNEKKTVDKVVDNAINVVVEDNNINCLKKRESHDVINKLTDDLDMRFVKSNPKVNNIIVTNEKETIDLDIN